MIIDHQKRYAEFEEKKKRFENQKGIMNQVQFGPRGRNNQLNQI